MNRTTLTCLATLLCVGWLFTTTTVWAQSGLNGAWKVIEASGHNAEGDWTAENFQPNLYLFLDGYYSIMAVNGDEARPLMADDATRESITDEEMRSIFMPFIANSGTYEISGSTFTTKPMVALWPNFMEGGSQTRTFEVEGDVLTLSNEGDGWNWTAKLQRLK